MTRPFLVAVLLLAACTAPSPSGPEAPALGPLPPLQAIRRGEGDGLVIVMLHGFGSRPEDMLSFPERTDLPDGTRFFFPFAPRATHPPEGPEGGLSWFPLGRDFRDPRNQSFPGMVEAREQVIALLDRLAIEEHVPSDRIVLGGFSQGAMLTTDVVLHDDRALAGIILMSGSFVNEAEWTARMPSRRGLRVLMTHGRSDDVLPVEPDAMLAGRMRDAGIDVRFFQFDGGHEVTPAVGDQVTAFLRDIAPD